MLVTGLVTPTVHPHACGADPCIGPHDLFLYAVHPHACGADVSGGKTNIDMGSRFIPTRVGQMIKVKSRSAPIAGSSPRVWGRLTSQAFDVIVYTRFIPTRVGQIDRQTNINEGMARFIPTRVGQIAVGLHAGAAAGRFIPTRVGQISLLVHCESPHCLVHPHACGADGAGSQPGLRRPSGSSPRVWGRWRRPAHCQPRNLGSSPRVWGRCAERLRRPCVLQRFIPTRVGQILPKMQL